MDELMEITAPMNLTVLLARLQVVRDVDPPMSIITLNQLIGEVESAIAMFTKQRTDHSGYEIGSGR